MNKLDKIVSAIKTVEADQIYLLLDSNNQIIHKNKLDELNQFINKLSFDYNSNNLKLFSILDTNYVMPCIMDKINIPIDKKNSLTLYKIYLKPLISNYDLINYSVISANQKKSLIDKPSVNLTKNESEILFLSLHNLAAPEIADEINQTKHKTVSPNTIGNVIRGIIAKFNCFNYDHMLETAYKDGYNFKIPASILGATTWFLN
jgi:DNA-binding CsgD family transcriptional regulator